ncbi:MAG: GTP-binding protein [Pelagibacteraceae bacterium]|nr:GTP-binding protein [Pelagibacteraceae bacterium]MCI5079009.1 GTP-binding protein [Pelagibacteraceae bacterium]
MSHNINIAIIGKPNVGKSTIFNKLIGKNVSEVSHVSGTTVYPIISTQDYKNFNLNLIDLGGLKKKNKSYEKIQKLITAETLNQLKYANIILFIVDGSDLITKNDKQLFRLILNKLKNVIVIINKTDLIKNNLKKKEDYFKYFFEKNYPNILLKPIFISALKLVKKEFLLKKICEVHQSSTKLLNNKDVNNVLKSILSHHQPAYSNKARPSIKFLRHVNSDPMIFKAFGNKLTSLSKEYKNYFIKQLLLKLKIFNQVVVIKYLNNKNPFKKIS